MKLNFALNFYKAKWEQNHLKLEPLPGASNQSDNFKKSVENLLNALKNAPQQLSGQDKEDLKGINQELAFYESLHQPQGAALEEFNKLEEFIKKAA
jgi:hypothetical protein